MGRSALDSISADIRQRLDQRFIESGFRDYRQLVEWLAEQGVQVSLSQVGRRGKELKDKLERVRLAALQAASFTETLGRDGGLQLHEGVHALLLERTFSFLSNLEDDSKPMELAKLAQGIGQLTKSGVGLKRYMVEVRERAEQVAHAVEQTTRASGLSDETIAQVKAQILGIAP